MRPIRFTPKRHTHARREAAAAAESARVAAAEAAHKAEVAKEAAEVAVREAEKFSNVDTLPPDAKVGHALG